MIEQLLFVAGFIRIFLYSPLAALIIGALLMVLTSMKGSKKIKSVTYHLVLVLMMLIFIVDGVNHITEWNI